MDNRLAEPGQLPPSIQKPSEPPEPSKSAWYSKMNWLGLITIIIGICEYLKVNVDVLQEPSSSGIITVVTGVLIIILRYFTTKPVKLSK